MPALGGRPNSRVTSRHFDHKRANRARGYLAKYSLLNVFKRMLLDRKFIGAYTGRWLEIYPHYLNGIAFGGLVGTVTGFAKFLQDQLRAHSLILCDSTRSQFYQQKQTDDGTVVQTAPIRSPASAWS